MANTQKKIPLIYAKGQCIRFPDQDFEQMVKAKIEETGFPSESAGIRHLLENRRMEIQVVKFSLDSAMWILCDIQKELELLHIDIMQIKKKLAETSIMHSNGKIIDSKMFDILKEQIENKQKNIFDTINKLSYLWLPE